MTHNAIYTATIVDIDSAGGATQTIVAGPTTSSVRGYHSTALQLTTDGKENDGIQLQAPLHPFTVTDAKEFYMETKFKVNDADGVDLYIGLADIVTTVIGGVTDGIGFRVADGSTKVSGNLRKNSTETQNELTTLALVDDTYVKLGLLKRANSSTVEFYVNDVLSATTITSVANLPNDEAIYPTIALLTGADADAILTIEYFYAYTK